MILRNMLLMVASVIFLGCSSSANKIPAGTSESDFVKNSAQEWFKKEYVDTFLSDPESYRLAEITVTPVDTKESLIRQIATIQNRIDAYTVTELNRTQERLDMFMKSYEESELSKQREQEYIDKGIDVKYHTGNLVIYEKYGLECLNIAKQIELYLCDIKEKERLESMIKALPQETVDEALYYDISLDCYFKDSSGNDILFKYTFPFSVDGPLGDMNGIDKVVLLL